MINPVFVPTSVLFAGALLQIVLAGILSRAAKGWLAFLIATIALLAVLAMMPAVIQGDILTATWFNWDTGIPLAFHVDGLSILFMLLGTGMGSAILLYSVGYMEEETEGITRFYVLMLLFIGGFVMLVCAANLLMAYFAWELIGLCSYFLVGFWYKQHAAAEGSRKVLIITHLAGYGLLAAIMLIYVRTGTFLWTDPAVDGFYRRHRPADDRGGHGQVGHVSVAHLDPRGHECADPGFGAVAFGVLRQSGSVPDCPHVLVRAVARRPRQWIAGDRLRDDAGRRGFCHGPDRPEAAARLPHREPARLCRDGPGAWHESRGCRGTVLRHQSCVVQRDAVHVRRRGAARHRHARHHEARRPLFAHAGDDLCLAGRRRLDHRRAADQRVRGKVVAVQRGAGCQSGGGRRCRLGGQPAHDLFVPEGNRKRVLRHPLAHAPGR